MTSGEWKFALKVEEGLNTLKEPEYRQLVVEALMLVGVVVQQDPGQGLGQVLVIDHLIQDAQKLFLVDQVSLSAADFDRSLHARMENGSTCIVELLSLIVCSE